MRILTPEQKAARRIYEASPARRAADAAHHRRSYATPKGKAAVLDRERRRYATDDIRAAKLEYEKERYAIKMADGQYRRSRDMNYRKWKYGIEPEVYDAMLIAQSGLCPICKTQLNPPHVDHEHGTGVIRGLLCVGCNTSLGQFGDTVEGLLAAVDYLRGSEHGAS